MPRSFLWSSGETDSHLAVRIKSYFQCSEHKKIFKTDQRLPGKILTKASLSIFSGKRVKGLHTEMAEKPLGIAHD